jgi:DNA-binding transcriptional ArsR family regulator
MSADATIINAESVLNATEHPVDEQITAKESDLVTEVRASLGENLLFTRTADLFHILSDPTRLRLIVALAKTPLCVGDLSQVVGLGQSATSHALRILRDRGIAIAVREGQQVRYHLIDEALRDLIRSGWRHAVGDKLPAALKPPKFTGTIQIEVPEKSAKKKKKKAKGKSKDKAKKEGKKKKAEKAD